MCTYFSLGLEKTYISSCFLLSWSSSLELDVIYYLFDKKGNFMTSKRLLSADSFKLTCSRALVGLRFTQMLRMK